MSEHTLRRILVATDFSTRSDRAVKRAGLLARHHRAALDIVHVVDGDQPSVLIDLEKQEAQKLLAGLVDALPELRGADCRPGVVVGDSFDAILRTADAEGADLIVMGAHRRQLLRDFFVGTTLERVIRNGTRPVLMVNRDPSGPYRHATVAVDLSDVSAHAARTARSLGLLNESEIDLMHVFLAVGKPTLYVANASQADIDAYVRAESTKAKAELDAFVDAEGLSGNGWTARVEEGDAYETLAKSVAANRSELIVVGTHGRSGLAKLVLGSVAEQVLRRMDADVLAVPPLRAT